jgi:hypothetical protein
VLLSTEFVRTETQDSEGNQNVQYTLEKSTPFGRLSSTANVCRKVYESAGAAQMDGKIFVQLAERLNAEETNMLVMYSANTQFGLDQMIA